MPSFSRRTFLKVSALTLGAFAVSTGLSGCRSSDDNDAPVNFSHGVASGDPLQNAVMIWTRAVPQSGTDSSVRVRWEVATDESFSQLIHDGEIETGTDHDFTAKIDVRNLSPGQVYFYRFRAGSSVSPTGRTRTLPEGSIDQVKLAVVSCSNYPAGLFHVYAELAKMEDLDAVLHLGDYIYEYDGDGYATEDAEALGRTLPDDNNVEIIELDDYRKRYALYRSDTSLQLLHSRAPFIAVWDDHEVTNDTWRNGAENHNEGEGDFSQRKQNALQAYFEWMPIRPVIEGSQETIYRSFQFGDLVALHMLDTRIVGRDEQLALASYFTGSGFNTAAFQADLTDPNRTLLGAEQRNWLLNSLAQSTATWDVLGQQVLMGRMNLPAELLLNLQAESVTELFADLAGIKMRYLQGDDSLTPQEIARVTTQLPYNLDAWDGYYSEREVVLEAARNQNRNLVVLAGDTHNAWANDLTTMDGAAVGVEFATSSVTSPGFEEYLQLSEDQVPAAEQALTVLVDQLGYANLNQRGFMLVTFTAERAMAEWQFVSTVKAPNYTLLSQRSKQLQTLPGTSNRKLLAVG